MREYRRRRQEALRAGWWYRAARLIGQVALALAAVAGLVVWIVGVMLW